MDTHEPVASVIERALSAIINTIRLDKLYTSTAPRAIELLLQTDYALATPFAVYKVFSKVDQNAQHGVGNSKNSRNFIIEKYGTFEEIILINMYFNEKT